MVGTIWSMATPTDVTGSTVTLADASPAGKTYTLNRAAGVTATLPAATGSGAVYRLYVGTTVTSNNIIVQVASSSDVIQGTLGVSTDAAGVVIPTAATSDTITMNGSTTGGLVGSNLVLQDVASGVWSVHGGLVSTGTEATPFSAAV